MRIFVKLSSSLVIISWNLYIKQYKSKRKKNIGKFFVDTLHRLITISSARFSEFDAGNVILFQIKVFGKSFFFVSPLWIRKIGGNCNNWKHTKEKIQLKIFQVCQRFVKSLSQLVCACLYVCLLGTNNFFKASSSSYKICTAKIIK